MRIVLRLLLALTLTLPPAAVASAATIRVFAAASLTEAFGEIADLYRKENPGVDVELNTAGSQVLRTQIEQGAPADVFASADRVHMDALRTAGLVSKDVPFARNRLVVVTPRKDPKVKRLSDLARPGIRIVVANANVPVGRYTSQMLGKMNKAGLYGDDFQRRFTANVLSQETNVRAVLSKVALDEVDAGVVYVTDAATAGDKVTVLDIPDRLNVVAEYPIAVVKSSEARAAADRFVELVLGEPGQAILARHGFRPAR